jgi:hypothetical protein
MPYFIDTANSEVVVRPPGATAAPGQAIIDGETAAACGLVHGQRLTPEQAQALLDGSPSRFRALLAGDTADGTDGTAPASRAEVPSAALPSPAVGSPAPTSTRSAAAQRANRAAMIVESVSWIVLILSVVLGVAAALQTRLDIEGQTVHPFVWAGIGIAIGGAFQALVVIMVAAYIQAKTE